MTTTYDPFHPTYFDEADLREELTRAYDICQGCRWCVDLCDSFPTLFELVDRHDDHDAARLTPAEQDRVVERCHGCKLCELNCPYIPGQSELALDFPRLMMRAEQVIHRKGETSLATKVTDQVRGRADLGGKLGTALAPVTDALVGTPGSRGRRLVERATGAAAERVLPPFARQRFSTWWRARRSRTPRAVDREQGRVAVFSTCMVEYRDPAVGRDLVKVYEHNGITCSLPDGQVCCGAPFLHQGDVAAFVKEGRRNIRVLADAVRAGNDVVVPQPTCGYVLKNDYVDYIGGPDAELVAAHTYDADEYLWKVHQGADTELSTDFPGEVPATITYHAPCHLRAQHIGLRSRDVMKLTGARTTVVTGCPAVDGGGGLRPGRAERSRELAARVGDAVDRAGGDVVAGDCRLANGGILQETGREPVHPLTVVRRAYGLPDD